MSVSRLEIRCHAFSVSLYLQIPFLIPLHAVLASAYEAALGFVIRFQLYTASNSYLLHNFTSCYIPTDLPNIHTPVATIAYTLSSSLRRALLLLPILLTNPPCIDSELNKKWQGEDGKQTDSGSGWLVLGVLIFPLFAIPTLQRGCVDGHPCDRWVPCPLKGLKSIY